MTHTDQIQVTDGMLIEWDVPIDMVDDRGLNARNRTRARR
jgi:hypothetical protein